MLGLKLIHVSKRGYWWQFHKRLTRPWSWKGSFTLISLLSIKSSYTICTWHESLAVIICGKWIGPFMLNWSILDHVEHSMLFLSNVGRHCIYNVSLAMAYFRSSSKLRRSLFRGIRVTIRRHWFKSCFGIHQMTRDNDDPIQWRKHRFQASVRLSIKITLIKALLVDGDEIRLTGIMMTSSNGNSFSCYWAFVGGHSPVTGEYPTQRAVTRSFDVFFYLRLNKRLNKQSWGWWFETPSRSLWRQRNDFIFHGRFM